MTLTTYSQVDDQMDRLLNEVFGTLSGRALAWAPACHTYEDEQDVWVAAAVPGFTQKDIEIAIEDAAHPKPLLALIGVAGRSPRQCASTQSAEHLIQESIHLIINLRVSRQCHGKPSFLDSSSAAHQACHSSFACVIVSG